MKINIQNLEHDLLDVDETIEPDFLEDELRGFYPRPLKVHVHLDHFGKDYKVDIGLETQADYICDRCLKHFDYGFEARLDQVYQQGGEAADDDVIVLESNSVELDVSAQIRESIVLNHPIKMLCSEDCKGLCPHCGANLNTEACTCDQDIIDPRWAKLRKFIK